MRAAVNTLSRCMKLLAHLTISETTRGKSTPRAGARLHHYHETNGLRLEPLAYTASCNHAAVTYRGLPNRKRLEESWIEITYLLRRRVRGKSFPRESGRGRYPRRKPRNDDHAIHRFRKQFIRNRIRLRPVDAILNSMVFPSGRS